MISYRSFLRRYHKPVSFGFSMTFMASFGQTFLISLYVPAIIKTLDISSGLFGSLYSAATLVSAMLLLRFGRRIDHRPLPAYTRNTAMLLALSCLMLGLAVHPAMLFLALLGLRFSGQGLMGNISQTTMSRHFERSRGKALSISSLGNSFGELFFPLIIGPVLLHFGWRLTAILSGFTAFAVIKILLRTLPVQSFTKVLEEDANTTPKPATPVHQLAVHTNMRNLMAKPEFWIIAPSNFMFSLTNTGYFFYQMVLVESRNWSPEWYRLAFGAYAIIALLASFGIGPIIDKLGARRLFPLYLLPTIIGLTAFGVTGKPAAIVIYLLLNGLSIGTGSVLKSSIYAELFGIKTLGAVRSLFTSIMVLGAALGPILFGYLLDFGLAMEFLMLGSAAALLVSSMVSMILWLQPRRV